MSTKYLSLIVLNIFLAFFSGTINAQEDTSSYTEPKVNPIKIIATTQTAINEPLLNEFLSDYAIYSLNYEELYTHVYSNNYFSEFKLTLHGKDYLFALQRNDLRSQDFKSATNDEVNFMRNIELNNDEEIQTFKGFANGKFENYIRVSVSKDNFWGYVYDKELDKFIYFQSVKSFLEAEDIISSNNNLLVFDLKNLKSKSNSECAVIKRESIEPRGQNEKCLPTYVEIATDADVEFFNRNSNNVAQANNRIRGLLNQMEGLYSANFNTMFILTFQNVNTTVIPQLSSTDAYVLLPAFESHRNSTWTNINRDFAILFSGKRLNGGSILGIAYTPGVCRSWHYTIISENSKTLLTANHEVGHLFNAQHDPVSDCGNASTAPIMCPSAISNIMRFSPTSINQILGYMSNQTCLNNFNSNLQAWAKTWTNERNSRWIGTWFYQNGDQKLVGDFDGDGDEELLFMSNSTWCNMLDYSCDIGSDWYHMWSNMGNRSIGTWFMNNGDKHFTGDFNGDGITDLLSISNSKSWATIGKYNKNTGSWSHLWSNMGNHWISGWYVQNGDDYKIADFDGDGKDELLCISSSGWAMLLDFENGTFNVKWHNNGNGSIGGVNANSINRYVAGNFATTNQKELLTWVNNWVTLLRWDNSSSNWSWAWSQYGASQFANMFILPLNSSQRILSGNFDNDTREEVLNINNTWSATADYSSGNFVQNWSNGGTSLINDWALNTNSNEYLTVKANPHNQKQILGMKSNNFNSLITASMYRGNEVQNKSAIANNITPNEVSKLEIMLYPNPNKGIFNLLVKNQTDFQAESQVTITDVSGRHVYSKTFSNPNIEMDLSSNPKGIYLIEIKTNGQTLNTKFIIE